MTHDHLRPAPARRRAMPAPRRPPAADERAARSRVVQGEIVHRRTVPPPTRSPTRRSACACRCRRSTRCPRRGIARNRRGAGRVPRPRPRRRRRHAARAVDPRPARRRGRRRRRRGRAVRLPADARLRVQSGRASGSATTAAARARGAGEVCNTFGERHNYLLAHADGRPLASGRDAERAQGLPRVAVLRGQGPLRVPLPLRRRPLARPHRLLRRRQRRDAAARDVDLRHARRRSTRAAVAPAAAALPLVHRWRRDRPHPLAGAEAVAEARAVLPQARTPARVSTTR